MSKNKKHNVKIDKNGFLYQEINLEEAEEIINKIDSKEDLICKYAKLTMEELNGSNINGDAEEYLSKMYPIRILFDRYQIQMLAEENLGRLLSEDEIEELKDIFIDNYPLEIESFISNLIEENFDSEQE
jgi:hypothetical protein